MVDFVRNVRIVSTMIDFVAISSFGGESCRALTYHGSFEVWWMSHLKKEVTHHNAVREWQWVGDEINEGLGAGAEKRARLLKRVAGKTPPRGWSWHGDSWLGFLLGNFCGSCHWDTEQLGAMCTGTVRPRRWRMRMHRA